MKNLDDRHPSTQQLARYFDYAHLYEPLRSTSQQCHDLAERMISALPDGPELTTGLRKLLEAKDCFVRVALDQPRDESEDPADRGALPTVFLASDPIADVIYMAGVEPSHTSEITLSPTELRVHHRHPKGRGMETTSLRVRVDLGARVPMTD